MRPKASIKLAIVIISLCPLLCRAAEGMRDSRQADFRLASAADVCCPPEPDREDRPSPGEGGDDCCPDGGNNCICSGIFLGDDAPALDHWDAGPSHPFAGANSGRHAHLHAFVRLTSNGQPAGLAGWGDARDVRAFLQNFRC